jgi:hypothetical protein
MRWILLSCLLGLAGPVSAQGFEIGPDGFRVHPYGREYHHHHREGGDCRELRAACMHKEELGEQGQGNCRRYREECGGG